MKTITIAFGLLLLSTPAFACGHLIPESTALYAIANDGIGDKEMKCSSLPKEPCVCWDAGGEWGGVWSVATLVDRLVEDKEAPIYSSECPQGKDGCEPIAYDLKVEGKKLVDDSVKLQALADQKRVEDAARLSKESRLQQASDAIKALNEDSVDSMTTAQLKTVIKAILKLQKAREDK